MLDSTASQRLREPSPWELAQWRAAAKRDREGWEQGFDDARFCYTANEALRALDGELRRQHDRKLWLGAAPAQAAASCVPTELVRLEYYAARNLFSWLRADYRTEAASKVTAWQDKVALAAEGAVVSNARALNASHTLAQGAGGNQVAAVTTSVDVNNREVGTFTAGQWYDSILTAAQWKGLGDGSAWQLWFVYRPTGSAAQQYLVGTTHSTGSAFGRRTERNATGAARFTVGDAASGNAVDLSAAGAATANVTTYLDCAYGEGLSPEASFWLKSTLASSGASAAAPGTSNPDGPLCLGAQPALHGQPASMLWADLPVANQISGTLQTHMRRYFLLRYNLS